MKLSISCLNQYVEKFPITTILKRSYITDNKTKILFLNLFLQTQVGINPELIHFIGHGLGAHMAAYTGQTTQKDFRYKLGRITGMKYYTSFNSFDLYDI
jgi:predicted esterase